jgi:hypothetical protein
MKKFIVVLFVLMVTLVLVERIFSESIIIKQFIYNGKVIKNGMKLKDVDAIVPTIGWSKDRQNIKVGAIEDYKNNKLYLLWFKNPKREARDDLTVENWELTLIQVTNNWR